MFFVRDRLRRLCEEWSALPAWLRCSARNYDFLLRCTVLHAPPRGHAQRACVVSRLGNMAYGWMKGDLAPNRMSTPPAVCTAPSRARVRARVRRFSFFAFTSSPVCRNLLCHSPIGVKVFRIEIHSRGEDKKEGRCSPQNACRSGEKVGQVKGEDEKRKLAEARVPRACARDVASPSPQWAIRDTETEQETPRGGTRGAARGVPGGREGEGGGLVEVIRLQGLLRELQIA